MKDEELEQIQQGRNLTAPRVTLDALNANIAGENYFTLDKATAGQPQFPAFATLTICVLTLKNGFVVLGESAPASPENFDRELGRKIAKQKAVDKVWPLMGYALKEDMFRASLA